MNARQLEIFRAIMRDSTLTAAANSLGISQPAASKFLHHLESQLGYTLFDRIGGRLVPTMEANLLFADADRVFREMEALKSLARDIGAQKIGLLRLGISLAVTYSVLPKALLRFRAKHPEVKVHLHALPKREIAEALLLGDIDLAVTLSVIEAPTVRSEILSDVPIVAVMRADDPLASKARIGPADLDGLPLISYGAHAEIGAAMDEAFSSCGLQREVAIQIASSVGAVPLVREGLGIALVDGLVAWHGFEGLVARPFEPRLAMQMVAATNDARPASRFVRPFLATLRDVL
ncbi:LysR substrate-binding domain-containing protein (plasmid) [Rhizobium sp. CB3060]|uniref:LysR substrate-binding domain-containing protein n=1 Tax=Rhizobium sp. CB3060 TaxID=3138255 RepID=UPI0021A84D7D|nr:LysR substrate-binding domain-containing protein [Rhizobium tropici]UWU23595.1 LysR substrate-binding domain-containing protein [Rhizobium tropici]